MANSEYLKTLAPDIKERYFNKISIINNIDPYTLKASECFLKVTDVPDVHYVDIVSYFIFTHSFYTSQQLKAYKSLEGFKFYEAGFVQKLMCKKVNENCVIVGEVKHSQRMNEKNLQTWLIILPDDSIASSHCTCMAGLGEVCSHVAAIAFALHFRANSEERSSCTDNLALWPVPAVSKIVKPKKLDEINWGNVIEYVGVPLGFAFVKPFVLDTFGYIARVDGISMQPTLNPDSKTTDYVFLNHWTVRRYNIHRGDVISFISPKSPDRLLIKRVVGLAGDVISTIGYKTPIFQIPDGHCWVEGDHTGYSMDSNSFGPVALGLITGKATYIVWPPSRWRYLIPFLPSHRTPLNLSLPVAVFRHGLIIGDVDNDGDNELVLGTAEGDLYIFKGTELWQKISGLGLISCVTIGDIFNCGWNALVVICGDGWAHVYYSPRSVNLGITTTFPNSSLHNHNFKTKTDLADGPVKTKNSNNMEQSENIKEKTELSGKMKCVHIQRIPTNTKIVLVADVDKDGLNEMIIGLTDRVVRSYRWLSNADLGSGKLVGLNKWECANQIGTVTTQHAGDGTPTLLVAQPGGTFMRIKCNPDDCHLEGESSDSNSEDAASCVDYQTLGISRMRNANISTEILGDLEPGLSNFETVLEHRVNENHLRKTTDKQLCLVDRKLDSKNMKSSSLEFLGKNYIQSNKRKCSLDSNQFVGKEALEEPKADNLSLCYTDNTHEIDQVDGNLMSGNIILGEYGKTVEKLSPLPLYSNFIDVSNNQKENGNMKNAPDEIEKQNNSELSTQEESFFNGKPYALATLDGTIMLVKDEIILWSMQVDHHIFALSRLDVTRDGADKIIACTWDGQTYILDQQRNSVRFQFEEPVRAFCTGMYNVTPGSSTPSFVYNTFNNKIFLYYDVILPSMILQALNPSEQLYSNEKNDLEEILNVKNDTDEDEKLRKLTQWLLYGLD